VLLIDQKTIPGLSSSEVFERHVLSKGNHAGLNGEGIQNFIWCRFPLKFLSMLSTPLIVPQIPTLEKNAFDETFLAKPENYNHDPPTRSRDSRLLVDKQAA